MKKSLPVKTFLIAAGLPLLAGCVHREVVYRDRPVPAGQVVVVERPAPPPRREVEVITVSPGPDYVWVRGDYEWRGRWVWTPGRWIHRPHQGAVWTRGGWVHRGHEHVWISGHWR